MKRVYNLNRRPKERQPVIIMLQYIKSVMKTKLLFLSLCLKYKPYKLGSHVESRFPPSYFTHRFSNIHVRILNINLASPDISMHILSLPAAAVRCKVPEKSSSEYQGLICSRLGPDFLLTGSNFCTFLQYPASNLH